MNASIVSRLLQDERARNRALLADERGRLEGIIRPTLPAWIDTPILDSFQEDTA